MPFVEFVAVFSQPLSTGRLPNLAMMDKSGAQGLNALQLPHSPFRRWALQNNGPAGMNLVQDQFHSCCPQGGLHRAELVKHLLTGLAGFCHFDHGVQMSRRTAEPPENFRLLIGFHGQFQEKRVHQPAGA